MAIKCVSKESAAGEVPPKQTELPKKLVDSDRKSGIEEKCDLLNSLISVNSCLFGAIRLLDKARGMPPTRRSGIKVKWKKARWR